MMVAPATSGIAFMRSANMKPSISGMWKSTMMSPNGVWVARARSSSWSAARAPSTATGRMPRR